MPTIRKRAPLTSGPVIPLMTAAEREAIDLRVPKARAWQIDEHSLQRSIFEEMIYRHGEFPLLRHLIAIPNAGKRSRSAGGRMKAEGMKAGVSDLFLAAGSGGKHGLWLELKNATGKPSADQWAWLLDMHRGGFAAHLVNDIQTARHLILSYVAGT